VGDLTLLWTHAGPSAFAAFLASLVEFVEALTVILAVGSVRGWRSPIAGAVAAVVLLLVLVAALGAALSRVPLHLFQLVIGALLLLFGLRWLRKAILRSAGVIPKHNEAAAFSRQTAAMRQLPRAGGWDRIGFAASFQITMLEGTEVVFIVAAIGAGGSGLLLPACAGALAALILVILLALAIRKPLSQVPENTLKFFVGVLLSAFGTFWLGEGIGLAWPGSDWSILALIAGFLAVAGASVAACRRRAV